MLDEAWEVVARLWAPMEALLGEGCRMDPSVFCWIAADAAPAAAPAAGANFGTPHRDFTCLQSLEGGSGAPLLLSVWVPLSDVSSDNGCMMVVPRQLDRHYSKRFAYAHMRPALPSDEEEGVTELRFELQAARPLAPLRRGSVVAWSGNLIHWGTRCSPGVEPRVAVGFNFLRAGVALQSGSPTLAPEDVKAMPAAERLALISRSLIAYSPWYQLSSSAMLRTLFLDEQS